MVRTLLFHSKNMSSILIKDIFFISNFVNFRKMTEQGLKCRIANSLYN